MHEDPETNSDTCTDMGCRTASVSIHLSCSPRFHLLPPRKQYLAEAPPFPIYRAFRDHSPPNAAIPSSHAPRIPTFSACRVAASNRTRDRTNVSPLVQTNACSVLPSGDAAPTTIILQIEKAVSGLYSNIRRLIFSNDRLLSRKERSISVLPLWKYIFTESRVS